MPGQDHPMTLGDMKLGEQIILNRLAMLEQRVQSLATRIAATRDPTNTDEAAASRYVCIAPDSQPWLGQGFHRPERDEAGNLFCWAGRDEYFEFRFFLDRRACAPFQLSGGFAAGVPRDMVRATVDYRPIPIDLHESGDRAEICGRIPSDVLSHGVTLTFYCPTVSVGPTGDVRRLSFAFRDLRVGDAGVAPSSPPRRGRQRRA